MSRINLRQVEAFHKVILTGGITQAANIMNITQPAVSRLIKDFEYAVKLKLFDRDGRGLEPREEALKLFREIERLYLGLDHILRVADDIRHAKGSVLRIGAVSALANLCTERIFPSLLKKYPDVALSMDVESTLAITEMVLSNQYDIGFINSTPAIKGLQADLLGVAQAVAVVAPTHPLAGRVGITLDDLNHYRAILPGRKTVLREQLAQAITAQDVALQSPIETSLRHCCVMAGAGLGVGIVDAITARTSEATLLIKPFEPKIDVAYLAIFPPQHARSLLVEEVVQLIRTLIGESASAG
ncbi:LysR substrate-binding domain-containing protein [Dickeya fangzhongdai]|uniref:LysR substrate-binding domain-containing protein n=1 Tax=Dickeya fangzhongdai TaxID=1778540 RepID=UPI0004F753E2|nr:LysR substrate-binding domain-containing protein [Dickeya fangzhongdai]AIR68435.1 LysR family transcriptional regulator [Dickeya fangzhongdai]KGT96460.1 LysR family transcriptional regulator [Dickeya fangzhongdai]